MAKKVQTTQLKGLLTVDNMEIEETIKDVPYVYDLLEVLRSYDEKTVTISIKEEEDLQPKED